MVPKGERAYLEEILGLVDGTTLPPLYAYGDNEAACVMADKLAQVFELARAALDENYQEKIDAGDFFAFLKRNLEEVSKWPEWKKHAFRSNLGTTRSTFDSGLKENG